MNEAKQRQLLAGTSGLARKVYDFVPIKEEWTTAQIHTAMRTASVTASDHRAIRACLGEMKDQGLIREVNSGLFQRTPVLLKLRRAGAVPGGGYQPTGDVETTEKFVPKNPPQGDVIPMPPKQAVVAKRELPEAGSPPPPPTSMDLLANLSSEITALGSYVVDRLQDLSKRIDEAALVIEAEREANADAVRQLQTLKDIFQSVTK
jgi:hypothetical protein